MRKVIHLSLEEVRKIIIKHFSKDEVESMKFKFVYSKTKETDIYDIEIVFKQREFLEETE